MEPAYGVSLASSLVASLNELEGGQRQVIVMKLFEGRSFSEVAETLGVSEEACRARFSRGLGALRERLSGERSRTVTGAVDVWTDPDLAELVREDAPLVAIADALAEGARARAQADDRRHRMALAAAVVLVVVAGLAPAVALSKSLQRLIGLDWSHPVRIPAGPQVHATLTSHVPARARPGARIRISWTLWSRNERGQVVPFDSNAIFARLLNPARTAASTASAHGGHGRYSAIVSVPSGGLGHVQIGIIAARFGPTGTHSARFLYPIANSP